MNRKSVALVSALVLASLTLPARADDKDLLKRQAAKPNYLIVFGNSQTTTQPLVGNYSEWDGDADSAGSKMGAAKRVIRQFVADRGGSLNIGMTTFAHNPNAGSITLRQKHWLYSPMSVDFPRDSWAEPAGTVERWGDFGQGPCTSLVPTCGSVSPMVNLPPGASITGNFFGNKGTGTAIIQLSASQRILVTLTKGKYGDAFTDGSLSSLTIAGDHSMEVRKDYQEFVSGAWTSKALTPGGSASPVTINYRPGSTLTPDLFYTTDPDAGKEIGFIADKNNSSAANSQDIDVNASCAGWEFQVNSAPQPLIKIPRDYVWGANCEKPPQISLPCVRRLLRPQGVAVAYDQNSGNYKTTYDHDNPGYYTSGSNYADGCDFTLLGGVDAGLDIAQNQVIFETKNGSQAPIKDLLSNIYDYFNKPAIDGFSRGKRGDDPNAACRKAGVVLIYDNFNGCQNDSCTFLTNQYLTNFSAIKVPIYVIGLGDSAVTTSGTGVCIAKNSGALLNGQPGYFPVTSPQDLYKALDTIAASLIESAKEFASASVSSVQAGSEQMAFLASFNATEKRSIWNGRINGYRLGFDGSFMLGTKTITDPDDPLAGKAITVPSNDPASLIWNTGQNLLFTPGTGATNPSSVLAPGAALQTGSYSDDSNDAISTINTHYYNGRKLVFSLPQTVPSPLTNLPIPPSDRTPETRYDMTANTGASWWPTLKALLGPQSLPPAVRSPVLTDTDATDSLRFIWGDRDAVMTTTDPQQLYNGLKLGDIFHSTPALVGSPANFFYFTQDLNGYKAYANKFLYRRQVLFAGANDGLLHAFEAGIWDRDRTQCTTLSDGTQGHCYDLGTGAELFAYAPRETMQIFKPLKDAVGAQTKKDEWQVDGAVTVADVFIDPAHNGTPSSSNRSWQTVLVGGLREGSPFEGTSGAPPAHSRGSYFALNITQPDQMATDANGNPTIATGSDAAPACLNGGGSCAATWPSILWEITDTSDLDVAGTSGAGYPDMGETWSRAAIGRAKICTGGCGTSGATFVDKFVAVFGGGFDRERRNRRGNWLYMVDVETGKVLMRANSSCGVNAGSGGCVPTYFGSMPAEPALLDLNGDGYVDVVYIGDQKGQMWRVDMTDMRYSASAVLTDRWSNKIDFTAGTPKPFLLFQAPQPSGATVPPNQFFPIYQRAVILFLNDTTTGTPTVGVGFGTGDRDDIVSNIDPASLGYAQRYYFVVDSRQTTTRTEADLLGIPAPNSPSSASTDPDGWYLKLFNGERVITDSLAVQGYINFGTFTLAPTGAGAARCANPVTCGNVSGAARLYTVYFANGNPAPGSTDRGSQVPNATFITNPIFFVSGDRQGHGLIVGDTTNPTIIKLPKGTKAAVKEWKEQ